MSLLKRALQKINEDRINMGPKENKRLNSLRRMANRYAEEDEAKRLQEYITYRQREEGAAAFRKGDIVSDKKKINYKKINSCFLGKTRL